ncbi:hypothetical protein C1632_08240 [Microbacterium testaceum]|nr:hypothetical protein C1632_08240 [Microbacterium testaceum]
MVSVSMLEVVTGWTFALVVGLPYWSTGIVSNTIESPWLAVMVAGAVVLWEGSVTVPSGATAQRVVLLLSPGETAASRAVAVPGAMVSFTYSVAVPTLLVAVTLIFQVPARVEDPARMPLVKVTPSGRTVLSVSSFSML